MGVALRSVFTKELINLQILEPLYIERHHHSGEKKRRQAGHKQVESGLLQTGCRN